MPELQVDFSQLIVTIEKQRGRYIKRTLMLLEQSGKLSPELRKIILDMMNDYTRSIFTAIGYEVER